MGEAPFDKLDDIVKGSASVIDSEVKSQVSVIKGQLKSDISEILQPYTALNQIGGVIRLIDRLLTNQLNSQRLEIIAEKRRGMEESIAFGRSQGHQDSELSGVRLYHEAEIRKYTMPGEDTATPTDL